MNQLDAECTTGLETPNCAFPNKEQKSSKIAATISIATQNVAAWFLVFKEVMIFMRHLRRYGTSLVNRSISILVCISRVYNIVPPYCTRMEG